MKVLVTGGAGFIGSHLADRLSHEHDVVVLDNLTTGTLSNLSLGKTRITFIEGDIRDRSIVTDAVKQVDVVFHLAADVKIMKSIDDPLANLEVNVHGTLNILTACLDKRIKRFIFGSSAAVYGEAKRLPVDEEHPLNPESPYAASKAAAEMYLFAFHKTYSLPVTCLRFFNVYGPRQSSSEYASVIPAFLNSVREGEALAVFGDGEQTRDFIYIEDVVRALEIAATHPGAVGQVFNVATGKGTSINELVRLVREVTGKEAGVVYKKARAGEVKHSRADIGKAQETLGFRARTSLKDGLAKIFK